MKVRSSILAAGVAVGLVAGAAIGAVAQDDEMSAPAAAYATGTIGWPPAEIVRPEVVDLANGNDELGLMLIDIPVEFSDSRISGMLTIHGNGTTREFDDGRAWIESRTHRIENDAGAWSGSGYLVRGFSDELGDLFDQETMVLQGEGAYDGYIAYVFSNAFDEASPVRALILQADELPVPDPVAAE